ncbi:NPCBM/NEW2 domain-containing protein [Terrisporobacter glycolicus]|uniref:NPCBM/NEW2 domain protein n=1 Tax=Terrisporobacter glycolicus ATCC 14880 = DSM 1288 TaxID=1121315 RepID=A0ABZ2EQH7_9FIRM|nr:NPCBM/NEW2 domain-containing protein [Terrisporobacter glycolicus]
MHKKKIVAVTVVVMISNFLSNTTSVLAQELQNKSVVQSTSTKVNQEIQSTKAQVSRFNLLNSSYLKEYNESFKLDNSKIISITNNGGKYGSSVISNAIDDNMSTHWETGKVNSSDFENEVVFTLDQVTSLNRIVYGARQDGAKGKGFAEEFEIYASLTDDGDDFNLVSYGEYKESTRDIVEIKFAPTKFKRIKFKFKKANQNWASASEFMFYKEDEISDKMNRLFTDSTMNAVSEEFNTVEKIEALENKVRNHVLYNEFKEDLSNAKILIQKESNIKSHKAQIQKFQKDNGKYEENYNNTFKIDNSEIEKISSNDGSTAEALMKAIDDNIKTYWSSRKVNTDDFKNEIIVQLKETTVLDRLIYGGTPGWQKGYAEEFEIYASKTTKGDTFKLVATGEQSPSHDIKEITFKPTEFKRIKFVFKRGNLNQSALSVFWLYKEDKLSKTINNIFTDGTMVKLKDEYNNMDIINNLGKEVNNHPLKDQLMLAIDLAKEILQGDKDYLDRIFTVKQNGDTHSKGKDTLLMSSFGNDFQSTGIVAKPEEVFNIFVEGEDNKPLPIIVFSQQEGHYGNWKREYQLKKGMNTIVVPEIYSDGWERKSAKGGAVYLVNKYTEDQQGKAPVVRIDGGEKFPLFNTGDNQEEFLNELKEYKKKLDKNPDTMVDIFEFNTKRLMLTGTTKAAYKVYVNEGVNIEKSIDIWNKKIEEAIAFAGLKDDESDPTNDATNIRAAIRLMQPYGGAYAASDHVGVQRHIQEIILRIDKNSINSIIWGTMHEIGHQMDIDPRAWGEITNNMWANYASIKNGKSDGVPYNSIYSMLGPEESLKGFDDFDYGQKLAMFWQLQLKKDTYWTELESMYRKRRPAPEDYQEKKDILATYSSEIIGVNLSHYFEKYGFTLSEKCKNDLKRLPNSNEKIWYLNTKAMSYTGNGFVNKDTGLEVSLSKLDSGIKLSMNIKEEMKEDLLGYEILKNGRVIGFTSGNSYIDTNVSNDENIQYEIIPYSINLKTGNKLEINSFKPSISIQQNSLILGLRQDFNPMDYVKVLNHRGENITSKVKVENNVNTSKQGIYEVKYIINDEGITTEKVLKVEVVSEYDYLSDSEWKSVTTQWGNPRRNTNIKGRVNGDIKTFEKGFGIHANGKITYDLSGKDYDNFEALLGVDMSVQSNNNSSITFKVVGDDKTLATTNVIKYVDNMTYINVPVKGVNKLVIEVNDGGNGNTLDHGVVANPKLTTNNAKPKINVDNKALKIGDNFNIMENVTATDVEDGDITSRIKIKSNNFEKNKVGRFEVVYQVTDSGDNVTTKKVFVTVSQDYTVKKSKFSNFENLQQYNEKFKLPIQSVSNNAGNYGSSVIRNVIDGNINTHWETNKPNSGSFKNEVIFNLGEIKEISKMAYASRRDAGGKGFAHMFEIYASDEAEGDDFYLVGEGTYRDRTTDVVEFNLDKVSARRIKFKFVEANQGWASLGEVAFYKEDKLANKIEKDLFTDNSKTKVSEKYNTLEKVEALREEVKNHLAYELFKADLNKAEEIIRAKFPTLNVEETSFVKLNSDFDLMSSVVANDKEDGNITSSVKVNTDGFTTNKAGEYTLTYNVSDSDSNIITKKRKVIVYSQVRYLSDIDWKSAVSGWKSVVKDTAVASSNKIKLNVKGTVKEFDKGIGAATNAEIIYNLDGNYSYFTTYLGTDKNYNDNRTSIIFKIFADGKEVYTSDIIRKDSKAGFVNLNVTGVKELKLVANDAGDGGLGDFTSWADTKVYSTKSNSQLTMHKPVPDEAEESINLNEIVNIKDKHIKSSIKKELNLTSDTITVGDMQNLTMLTVQRAKSLEGLQYAKNLKSLNIEYNEINDLSPLKNLKKLTDLNSNPQIISAGNIVEKKKE